MPAGWGKILKTLRSIAAMIVIAALSLYVYEYFKQADRRGAMDEAAVIREQTRALQAQAIELNERLRSVNEEATALKSEVQGQRNAVERSRAQQQIARYLAEGLQMAQSARVAIAESYQANLHWPDSNDEAGLPEASQMRGEALQRVQVGAKGVVALTYDEKSGVAGGVIRLVPEANPSGNVTWRCETASYPTIAEMIPTCRYVARAQ